MFWPVLLLITVESSPDNCDMYMHALILCFVFAVKSVDVIALPYQCELVEHSAIFSDVSCFQRYRYLVLPTYHHTHTHTGSLSHTLFSCLLGEVGFPIFSVRPDQIDYLFHGSFPSK